jgi:hypothetical protein
MEYNLFENYPNNKINFEEKWHSSEWINLETHTQLLSRKKFISYLLNNLQIRNESNPNSLLYHISEKDERINKNTNKINSKIIFI